MQPCMVLSLNKLSPTNLILICSQFLLANGECMGIIAGIVVIYTGIKKNSMDSPEFCSAIIVSFITKI